MFKNRRKLTLQSRAPGRLCVTSVGIIRILGALSIILPVVPTSARLRSRRTKVASCTVCVGVGGVTLVAARAQGITLAGSPLYALPALFAGKATLLGLKVLLVLPDLPTLLTMQALLLTFPASAS